MAPAAPSAAAPEAMRIGLIAGGGKAPIEIAGSLSRTIARSGGRLHIVAIDGEADTALFEHPHTVVGWSELGKAIAALKSADVRDVLLVGTMARPKLSTAKFDFALLSILPTVLKILRQPGDDALLRTCIEMFERRGFRAVGVRDVAPDLLIAPGPIGAVRPSFDDDADIAIGLDLIAALGRFDIGQAAVVKSGRIIAIEGAEGTDAMLARVAQAAGVSADLRGVLVKRPKPGQDLRVDLPAIGPATVARLDAARLAGVAAMAGYVLALERAQLVYCADKAGVFVAGVEAPLTYERGEPSIDDPFDLRELGAVSITSDARRDAELGLRTLGVLERFGAATGIVVRKRRVMAIGASEPAIDVIKRDAAFNKRGRNSRRGVAVIADGQPIDAALISAAAAGGVAAIVIDQRAKPAAPVASELSLMSNSLRMALVVAEQRT